MDSIEEVKEEQRPPFLVEKGGNLKPFEHWEKYIENENLSLLKEREEFARRLSRANEGY